MISELTKSQEKKVNVYLNKWIKIGRRTKTMDKKKAEKGINFLYEKILNIKKPKHIIYLDSPLSCQLAANIVKNYNFYIDNDFNLSSKLSSNLSSNLSSKLNSNLSSKLSSNLRSKLSSKLSSNLRSNLSSNLSSNLDSNLDSNLKSNLSSNLSSNLRSNLSSNLSSNLDSNLDSNLYSNLKSNLESIKLEYFYWCTNLLWWPGWTGFYDFVLNELFPKKKKDFKLFIELTTHWKELHYYLLFPEIAFVSDFPELNTTNDIGQLHSYDIPALLYRDGYSLFYSNGVEMSKEQIITPAKDITKEMFLSETNVDKRRELSRKIGIEKTVEMLGAEVIDTYKSKSGGLYELLMIDFDNRGNKRPYLKMKNQSLKDVWHIEGVDPNVKTVKEAIMFRNKLTQFIEPEEVT